jgi:hypothetical protein
MIIKALFALAVTIALLGGGGSAFAGKSNKHMESGSAAPTNTKHVVLPSGIRRPTMICKPVHSHNCHPLENAQ